MRLRTEHWVLLAVLGLGLALLVLQLRQRWSFPALQELTTATPGAATESAPQETEPKDDSEPHPTAPSTEDLHPAPAEAHPQQPAAPQGAAAAEGSPSAEAAPTAAAPSGSPAPPVAVTEADAAMELRLEPARVRAQQPFVIFVALRAPAGVVEVVFDLVYDAGIVAPETGTHAALNALAVDATLPEMIVESPGAGRMRIKLRRTEAETPSSSVSSDLCAFQFMATQPGRTTLRLESGRLHFSDDTHRNVGAHEAGLEVD
ncbi:MAG: hypothetical protein V3U98_00230 [Acidobacteriota bacterium]